jgi:hypothetical protein
MRLNLRKRHMIDIEQFLMSLRRHKDADGKLKPIYLADTLQEEITIIQEAVKHSQRWVGLTEEEVQEIMEKTVATCSELDDFTGDTARLTLRNLEAKLKEKNT